MSLHDDAVAVLGGWAAPDPAQDRLRAEFLDHLAGHPDAVWRSCVAGHLTASTAVLDPSGSKVLLTLHRKAKRWLQLGGHCEPGDLTLAGVALREATEESGIAALALLPGPVALDRHRVRCHPEGSHHLDVQYIAIASSDRHRISDESDDLRWFGLTALPETSDDAVRRLIGRAREVAG